MQCLFILNLNKTSLTNLFEISRLIIIIKCFENPRINIMFEFNIYAMSFIKPLLYLCCLLTFTSCTAQTKFDLLIGTYTNRGSSSEGIYVYTFDSKTGELEYKNEVGDIDNPSYLAISPDHKNVYAVSESGRDPVGMVYAYDYDSSTGKLTFKNKES